MMGKMLDGCTHTHYVLFVLFLQFSLIGGNRLQFFGPQDIYFRFNQTQASQHQTKPYN